MKFKFAIFVMVLAAMGPARDTPAPEPASRERATSPEELAARRAAESATEPAPAAPEIEETRLEYGFADVTPEQFLWRARPVVIFADTPNDPAYVEQLRELRSRPQVLLDRDVVVILDTDPSANSIWRRQLHPRGFSVVIMDKDGQVKQRRPFPTDLREITRTIDRFPLRRQEMGRAGLAP